MQSCPAQQGGVRLFPIVVAHLDFEERRKEADKQYANTMSSEAFRINDANNATPTTPKMSSGKMGPRAVRAKDVMRMPAARDIKEHHRKIRPLVDLGTMTPTAQNA